MNIGLIILQLLPFILYVLGSYWKGPKAGVIGAILGALFLLGFQYVYFGEIDLLSIGECAFVLILGLLSIQFGNDRFFKFQPTVVAFLLASVFIYYEFQHKHFMVEYIPHLKKIMMGDQEPVGEVKIFVDNLDTPVYIRTLGNLSRLFIVLFLLHGLLMIHAALHCTAARWFAYRLAVYPGILVVVLIAMVMSGLH